MNVLPPQVGRKITFRLKFPDREVTAVVTDICVCPIGRHENKAGVDLGGDQYGIPFSEIIAVQPANGEQLKLF